MKIAYYVYAGYLIATASISFASDNRFLLGIKKESTTYFTEIPTNPLYLILQKPKRIIEKPIAETANNAEHCRKDFKSSWKIQNPTTPGGNNINRWVYLFSNQPWESLAFSEKVLHSDRGSIKKRFDAQGVNILVSANPITDKLKPGVELSYEFQRNGKTHRITDLQSPVDPYYIKQFGLEKILGDLELILKLNNDLSLVFSTESEEGAGLRFVTSENANDKKMGSQYFYRAEGCKFNNKILIK